MVLLPEHQNMRIWLASNQKTDLESLQEKRRLSENLKLQHKLHISFYF